MDTNIKFVDAQEMKRQYPDKFFAPDIEELVRIQPGDFIKVCTENERFWVEVISVEDGVITGRVDNDLITQTLRFNDVISLEPRHVYDIMPPPKNVQKKKPAKRQGKGLR